jgi:hypothetical protein
MKTLATGADGGPNIRSGNLQAAIGFLEFGEDQNGLFAKVGVQSHRMIRRQWNYALILEGPGSNLGDSRIHLRGGHDFGEGARRPFMARSLLAAA